MQNRRRKRVSSSPCRVVKRPRSLDRAEMRPFIKQIETLKAEKYQLEQKIQNTENSQDIAVTSDNLQSEILHDQVSEFQIQFHHQTAEIQTLQRERDAVMDQLTTANIQIANQASTNETLENQLVQVTQNASAMDFAKHMLSESLKAMINDYQNLSKEHAEKTAQHQRETTALKEELKKMETSCKEGALKIAQTAKVELIKLHEENFRVKKLLEDLMDKPDHPLRSVTKCSICLGVKNLSDFSISEPCGHMHCKCCAEKLTKSKNNKSCPSCRGPVASMVKIFA